MFNTNNPSNTSLHAVSRNENGLENARHQTRSKRGRQSNNDDSVKLPTTKKRRSALRRDTFEPLTPSSLNEIAGQPRKDAKPNVNGYAVASQPSRSTPQPRELTLRGGKKTEKRSERGLGLLTLSTNDFYTVSQLPALPEQIRSKPTVPYSCYISPDNDYILALTHRDALVWSYNASSSNPSSRELLSFSLPFQPAPKDDPLPLGAFTTRSANGEPGIVVVSPTQGKVVYWESLTAASTYGHNQSVEGTIPGMSFGDLVKDLVPAEPVGFIMTLTQGRVVQLTIRDQIGRPGIGFQFMRKSHVGPPKTGFFGSIRNVFVGDRRKGPVARPGKTARAQREVVICTEDGEIELWTNNLLTGNQLTKTMSSKEQILAALEAHINKDQIDHTAQLKLLDFCVNAATPSRDLVRRDDPESVPLVVLVALSSQGRSFYYLVELALVNDEVQIRVVHPIRCYTGDVVREKASSPKICIPSASRSAFVLFEKSVVIMSIAKIEDTPSSQLLRDRGSLPQLFQDRIALQDNPVYRIINFAGENDGSPSCVFAIQGFGIARITSHLPNDDEIEIEEVTTQLSARARIEQAIFFGSKATNPLDLRRSQQDLYTLQEIRQAVISISRSIVMSTSTHIPKSASSTAEQLQQRARALQDLMEYTLKTYPKCLGKEDRFALLRNAEKVAAAQALWKVQEKIQSTYPRKDDREMPYLDFVLRGLSEKRQKYPQPERGETDHVRHYLIHSVSALDKLLTELQDAMFELGDMNVNDPRIVCDYFLEGLQLWTSAMETAFQFREDNAAVYGLGNETFKEGVLQSGYAVGPDAPSIWTSTKEQREKGLEYLQNVCEFLRDWWNYAPTQQNGSANPKAKKARDMPTNLEGEPYDAPSKAGLRDLADTLPQQVGLLIRMLTERKMQQQAEVKASDSTPEQKDRRMERLTEENHDTISRAIKSISIFCREGSTALAEAQGDTDLLVDLHLDYLRDLVRQRQLNPDNRAIEQKIRQVQEHIETYYDRFGNKWAYSNFSSMIDRSELSDLLIEGQQPGGQRQSFLTWFFDTASQEGKHLGKIAWMNDILGEDKFDKACETLENVASVDEAYIDNKKAEICLAKLSGLAALEDTASGINETKVSNFDHELEYLHIIESLAAHVSEVCFSAVDDQAAVELAEERFIPKHIITNKKLQHLRKQLSGTLYKLVVGRVVSLQELVDALTILTLTPLEGEDIDIDVDDLAGSEFSAALQAIKLANVGDVSQEQKNQLWRTVWRRLLVRDDWDTLNATSGKSDAQVEDSMQRTVLFTTLLEVFRRADTDNVDVVIPTIDEILASSKSKPEESHEKLTEDVKLDLAQLKKYVDKARLRDRFKDLEREAKEALRRFQDQRGEKVAEGIFLQGANGRVNGGHG